MKQSIIDNQGTLIKWATAYEQGEQIVTDDIYDMQVRLLQRLKAENNTLWDEIDKPEFRSGSWEYTGMFIHENEAMTNYISINN